MTFTGLIHPLSSFWPIWQKEGLDGVVFLLAYRPTEMSLASHPFVPIRQELIKRRI